MSDDVEGMVTAIVAKARPERRDDHDVVQMGVNVLSKAGLADGDRVAVGGKHFKADEDMGSTGLVRMTWTQRDALGVEIGETVPVLQPEGTQPLGVETGEGEPPDNPNKDIQSATWNTYRKTHATWAVKLPVDVTIPTREGEVEGKGGDYLCIDADGGLYPCDAETFEAMYEPSDDSFHE